MGNRKISIADDHNVIRKAMVSLINEMQDFEVISDCENGKELLDELKHELPDIILLDVDMPVMDGFETLKELMKLYKDEVKVLILSIHDEFYVITKMLELGANGYISKKARAKELEHALNTVYEYDFYLSPEISKLMVKDIADPKPDGMKINKVEEEIIRLVCDQKTNSEIGEILKLSPNTVNTYRTKLLEKTGSSNLVGLVVFAIRNGIYRVKTEE